MEMVPLRRDRSVDVRDLRSGGYSLMDVGIVRMTATVKEGSLVGSICCKVVLVT